MCAIISKFIIMTYYDNSWQFWRIHATTRSIHIRGPTTIAEFPLNIFSYIVLNPIQYCIEFLGSYCMYLHINIKMWWKICNLSVSILNVTATTSTIVLPYLEQRIGEEYHHIRQEYQFVRQWIQMNTNGQHIYKHFLCFFFAAADFIFAIILSFVKVAIFLF